MWDCFSYRCTFNWMRRSPVVVGISEWPCEWGSPWWRWQTKWGHRGDTLWDKTTLRTKCSQKLACISCKEQLHSDDWELRMPAGRKHSQYGNTVVAECMSSGIDPQWMCPSVWASATIQGRLIRLGDAMSRRLRCSWRLSVCFQGPFRSPECRRWFRSPPVRVPLKTWCASFRFFRHTRNRSAHWFNNH